MFAVSGPKKKQGSVIGGFLLGLVAMAVGSFAATRFIGDGLFIETNMRDKAIAALLVIAPLFFVGQRALAASSAGRDGEARGLWMGLVCGAMAGLFLSFGVGFRKAGL